MFKKNDKPLLTCMIQEESLDECIQIVKNGIYDGAEAFGFQICRLKPEFRTEECYNNIFNSMGNRPIYITNYHSGYSEFLTDEERIKQSITALKCGANLIDIPGNFFSKDTFEMTYEKEAIKKQKTLIEEIHSLGGKVLISTHVYHYLSEDEVLKIALEQQNRGADVVKIVTGSDSEKELTSNLDITRILKEKLDVPFLFLSVGNYCKIHRVIGPMLGCCMWLCAPTYDKYSTKNQPLLRSTSELIRNFDYTPNGRNVK